LNKLCLPSLKREWEDFFVIITAKDFDFKSPIKKGGKIGEIYY